MSAQIFTSWDDGHPLDFKLAKILAEYKIPGIFFICLNNQVTESLTKSQIQQLSQKFEIGAHTLTHPDLSKISPKRAKEEILGSKKKLEDIIGKEVTKFCYPDGKFNSEIIKLVKNAGFIYARTASWFHTEVSKNPLVTNPTIHFYPHPRIINLAHLLKEKNWGALTFYFKNGLPSSLLTLPKIFLEKTQKEGGIFHLWGHSWEIEELNLWWELERVLRFLRKA